MRYVYEIKNFPLGESDMFEPDYSIRHVTTWGNSLEDLLLNASYSYINRYGEVFASGPADDKIAVGFIKTYYQQATLPIGVNPIGGMKNG